MNTIFRFYFIFSGFCRLRMISNLQQSYNIYSQNAFSTRRLCSPSCLTSIPLLCFFSIVSTLSLSSEAIHSMVFLHIGKKCASSVIFFCYVLSFVLFSIASHTLCPKLIVPVCVSAMEELYIQSSRFLHSRIG